MRERLLFPSLHILKPERWMIHGWENGSQQKKEDTFHPLFIKNFEVKKKPASARLYICGLGLFEAKLNGKKIGEEVLTPYYSNYHDEEQYLTFDVMENIKNIDNHTEMQETAENQLAVSLGNGWYKGKFGLNSQSNNFGDTFKLIAELRLIYEDGEIQVHFVSFALAHFAVSAIIIMLKYP